MAENKSQGEEKPILEYTESDFVVRERSVSWYFVLVLISLAFAAIFYWQSNWSGMIFVLSAMILFFIISRSKPRKITTAIYDSGVVVDDRVYRFEEMKGFHVKYGDVVKVAFEMTGFLSRLVMSPVPDDMIDRVVGEIKKKVAQGNDQGEDMVDQVNRWMKF